MTEENKEIAGNNIVCEEVVIACFSFKLFGIPVFSIKKTLNENELYKRMEKRFEGAMTIAIIKASKG